MPPAATAAKVSLPLAPAPPVVPAPLAVTVALLDELRVPPAAVLVDGERAVYPPLVAAAPVVPVFPLRVLPRPARAVAAAVAAVMWPTACVHRKWRR